MKQCPDQEQNARRLYLQVGVLLLHHHITQVTQHYANEMYQRAASATIHQQGSNWTEYLQTRL